MERIGDRANLREQRLLEPDDIGPVRDVDGRRRPRLADEAQHQAAIAVAGVRLDEVRRLDAGRIELARQATLEVAGIGAGRSNPDGGSSRRLVERLVAAGETALGKRGQLVGSEAVRAPVRPDP